MAVVKLGNKVKTNLPDTIRYVINLEKNDGGRLVYASYSSERHDANTLAEPMIRDLERCANGLRKDGVLALHLKHSFSPDEHVSAEQVHELGVMLAEAITGGDYKYVVSTHMDRHHLHNHIVICAANRRTGRKMRLTRRSIDRWRAISDELCRREGLTVLENPKVGIAVVVQEFDGGGVGWYLVCVAVGGDGDASPRLEVGVGKVIDRAVDLHVNGVVDVQVFGELVVIDVECLGCLLAHGGSFRRATKPNL